MNKIIPLANIHRTGFAFMIALILIFSAGCKKTLDTPTSPEDEVQTKKNGSKELKDFKVINLVANNNEYGAAHIDPNLINAWGLAFTPTGIAWIGAEGGHVSTIYTGEGVTVLPPVNIPSPTTEEGGSPTGVIFNPNAGNFIIPSGNAQPPTGARFIFVGTDGVVSAWNGTWGNHAYRKFNKSATSVYTGLTLADNGGSNFLYAANFGAGKIDVWDKNWNAVSMPFKDPHIPPRYSPFNIQKVGDKLYVMYAKAGPEGDEQVGPGKGFVDIYTTNGALVKRFVSRGQLNAPWGVALAPASFFPQEMEEEDEDDDHHDHDLAQPAILVGNFGDGRINVYSLKGKFLGQLRSHKWPITIEGLWAISFPPATSALDPNRLYFTAGPDEETHGLFGYIIKDDDDHEDEH